MKYLLPDSAEIKKQVLLKYKEEFLKLNNLKIGDLVTLEFPYQRVYKEPRKQENTVTWNKPMEGILKEDKDGYLYAESLEDADFYRWNSDNMRRPFYELQRRKSTFKFRPSLI